MKGEGLQGGGLGQDVTASFLHLFGNLRGIDVLRHNKTLECLQKRRCLLAQPGVLGTALRWIGAGSTRARRQLQSTSPCVCSTRRGDGEDSWQGLCSCWGDVGGVWELAILAAELSGVTPISTVRSWS